MSNTPRGRTNRDPRGNNYKELTHSKEGITPDSEVIFTYKGDETKGKVLKVYSKRTRGLKKPQEYILFEWKDQFGDKHISNNIRADKVKIFRTPENIESERRRYVRNMALKENWGQNETLGNTNPNQVHWEQFLAMASEKKKPTSEKKKPTSDQNLIKLKGVSRKKRKQRRKPIRKTSRKNKSKKSKK